MMELKVGDIVAYDHEGTGNAQIIAIVDGAWVVARRRMHLWGYLKPFVEDIGTFREKVEAAHRAAAQEAK